MSKQVYIVGGIIILCVVGFVALVTVLGFALDKQAKADCLNTQAMFADVRSTGAVPVAGVNEAIKCAEYGIRL